MPPNHSSRFQPLAGRVLRFLIRPSQTVEIVSWLVVASVIAAGRVYLWHLLPAYLWSKDSRGYAFPAIRWLGNGLWENDPKRGPVYSVFIAFCLKIWGTFDAVVILQHVLGGIGVLVVAFYLRVMWGRAALWPAIACGVALACYGKLLYLEHLIRNDWMLFVFAAVAFMAWGLWFRSGAVGWLLACGLGAGLLAITRNILAPFPLLVLMALCWQFRRTLKAAGPAVGVLCLGLALPYLGAKVFRAMTAHDRPAQPQGGGNLFARVAQWTVLDGGIEPEIKELIRFDIELYREGKELDSNIILNRTAVPKLRAYFEKLGKTPSELDQLCWRLAWEAIRAHPGEYARQFGRDLREWHLELGSWEVEPSPGDVRSACRSLRSQEAWAQLRVEECIERLTPGFEQRHYKSYRWLNRKAWLFAGMPVLFTSLGVTMLALFRGGRMRLWWMTAAACWWFTMIMLSTIGRPLGRYLLPVVPIIYWTLGSLVVLGWMWVATWVEHRLANEGGVDSSGGTEAGKIPVQ